MTTPCVLGWKCLTGIHWLDGSRTTGLGLGEHPYKYMVTPPPGIYLSLLQAREFSSSRELMIWKS